MQIGTSGRWVKGIKHSAWGVSRSKVKVTRGRNGYLFWRGISKIVWWIL